MIDTYTHDFPKPGVTHTFVAEYTEFSDGETFQIFAPHDISELDAQRYASREGTLSIWMLIDLEYKATEV